MIDRRTYAVRASMCEESESRQHGEYDGQPSKHLETARTEDDHENNAVSYINDRVARISDINEDTHNELKKRRRRAVFDFHGPEENSVNRSRYKPDPCEANQRHEDEYRRAIFLQPKHRSQKKYLKTDKQLKTTTKDIAIKYLQKLKHFTLTVKKTGATKLTNNIFKRKEERNLNRASNALVFLSDSQCNFRSFASNYLSSSFSNRSNHPNDEIPDEAYENCHLEWPSTDLSSKSMLKSKLSYFFNSQIPDKYPSKHSVILNCSFHCNSICNMVQHKKKLDRQSSKLSTSTTKPSLSTEESCDIDKGKQFHPQVRSQSYEEKAVLEYVYSQRKTKQNGGITEYANKNTKIFVKKKLRQISFNKYQTYLMSKYQTYFAELDYNNLTANRQAVGIGSTFEFTLDLGRSTMPGFTVIGEPGQGQSIGKPDQVDTSKRRTTSKIKLKPYECLPGVCIPGKCEPNECFRRLNHATHYGSQAATPGSQAATPYGSQAATPYGSHATTQSRKYEIQEQKAIKGKVFDRQSTSVIKQDKNSIEKTDRKRRTRKGIPSQGTPQLPAIKGTPQLPAIKGTPQLPATKGTPQRPATQGTPQQQATRITSKLSVNIKFYKDAPLDSKEKRQKEIKNEVKNEVKNKQGQFNQGDTAGYQKLNTGKTFVCDPGVCVPGKCDPQECFKRINASQVGTRKSSASSHGTSHSSQTSRKQKQELRTGKETLYKEKGISSIQKPKQSLNIPNRQAVRIGSKCSFNVEFYKSMPFGHRGDYAQNVQPHEPTNESSNNVNTKKRKEKKSPLKSFECEPGVCIPGKCNPIECYQRIKAKEASTGTETSLAGSSNTTSHGSQASAKKRKGKGDEKGTYYKDKGASSMPRPKNLLHVPNRQAIRIGSKCNFNIEFYKASPGNPHMPHNQPGLVFGNNINTESNKKQANRIQYPGQYAQGDMLVGQKVGTRKKRKATKPYECEPGVCIPGRCDPNECIRILKPRHEVRGTENPVYNRLTVTGSNESDFTNVTYGNKVGVITAGKASFYKDTGALSMRQPRMQLQDVYPKDRQVRIGSNCSFNIEFFKSMPGAISEQNNQPVAIVPNQPNLALQQHTAKQAKKGRKQGAPQPVAIMPNQPNIALQQHTAEQVKKGRKQGAPRSKSKSKGKSDSERKIMQYVCEPGVCIPDKCNPSECFARLKAKHDGASTDASLAAGSNGTSNESQVSTQTKKRKITDPRKKPGKESSFYKDKAASTLPRSKMPLHIPNRQVVRIGSKCSFNMEFYKDMGKKGLTDFSGKQVVTGQFPGQFNKIGTGLQQMECEPGVCVPKTCDPKECYQRLTGTPWVPIPIDTGSAPPKTRGPKKPQKIDSGGDQQKSKPKKAKKPERDKKQKTAGTKEPQTPETDKQISDQPSSKTSSVTKTTSSTSSKDKQNKAKKTVGTEKRSKDIKGKINIKKQSPPKHDHGDAGVQHKASTESKRKQFEKITKASEPKDDQADATREKESVEKKSAKKKSVEKKPVEKKSVEKKSVEKKSVEKKSVEKKSVEKKPVEKKPVEKKPVEKKSEERIKSSNEGTSTDASHTSLGSEVATQSKIAGVDLEKKNKGSRERREGKEHSFVKEKATSSSTSSDKITKKDVANQPPPRYLRPRPKKTGVCIGSTCRFNITFYRNTKPKAGSQINRELRTITPRSSVTQTRNRNGIMPFIKKCCCQAKYKQKFGMNKGPFISYDQGSNTDECEPGICVPNKCDPNECFEKMRDTGTGNSRIPKSTPKFYGTNAATQSRRFPIDCMRQQAELLLATNRQNTMRNGCFSMCMPPNMCFPDNFAGRVKENAVILGSGCNFNIRFGKKKKKKGNERKCRCRCKN